jgi:hypothetical protein
MPDKYTEKYLTVLGPLREILLVAGDYNDDDRFLPIDAEDLQARADEFREEYAEFRESVKYTNGIADRILYLDRSGNFC